MKRVMYIVILSLYHYIAPAQILKKPIPEKLIVLTFDDGVKTHYTVAAPLLKQFSFGATFYVCEFPPNYSDTTKYMTWNEIKQLDKMGFEVGNHTATHKHVNKLSKANFITELKYIENKCDSLRMNKPLTFAYPGYDTHPMATETLQEKGYKFARTGGNRPYNPLVDHPYLIPGYTTTKTNRQEIMDAFTKAKDGNIVILTIHGVPDFEHDWVTTPAELFKEYLQYLYDNHYKVVSMKDLLEYIHVDKSLNEIKPGYQKKIINNNN
jgi:peptidoglycan/xylan/chitin deacetylase (PgdA/CDA1 family)